MINIFLELHSEADNRILEICEFEMILFFIIKMSVWFTAVSYYVDMSSKVGDLFNTSWIYRITKRTTLPLCLLLWGSTWKRLSFSNVTLRKMAQWREWPFSWIWYIFDTKCIELSLMFLLPFFFLPFLKLLCFQVLDFHSTNRWSHIL